MLDHVSFVAFFVIFATLPLAQSSRLVHAESQIHGISASWRVRQAPTEQNMQYIQEDPPEDRKKLGLGWKGITFAIVVVILSLLLSIAAVDVVTAALG